MLTCNGQKHNKKHVSLHPNLNKSPYILLPDTLRAQLLLLILYLAYISAGTCRYYATAGCPGWRGRQTEPRRWLLNTGRGRPHLRRAPAGSVCKDKPPTTLHLDTLGTHWPITGLLKSSGSPRDLEVNQSKAQNALIDLEKGLDLN